MLKFAFANLHSRPGRTALSVLGLTIAIAGMVGLFSIAGGIANLMSTTFGDIPGVIVLQPGSPLPLFSALPAEWGDELAAIEGVRVVNQETWGRVNLIDGKPIISPPRLLFGMEIPTRLMLSYGVYASAMVQGRFFEEADVGLPHTVISRQIAESIDKTVGDTVSINSRDLKIIGIYHCGSLLVDMVVIVDIDVMREMSRMDTETVSAFYVEPQQGVTAQVITERIDNTFRGRDVPERQPAGLLPSTAAGKMLESLIATQLSDLVDQGVSSDSNSDVNEEEQSVPLEVKPVSEWGDRLTEMTGDLDLILGLLTAVGLVIAVSSILNTMLMSVSERTVEFGILRANGWSQGDIVKLITYEAALIGIAGGILGIITGWMATQVINNVWADRIHLYAGPTLLGFSLLFALIAGMCGGLYPAIRAARLSPMDAIRRG